jgi:hypothetical protein
MKRCIVGGSAALLMAAWVIALAPTASAGCLYGGPVISKCDSPVGPDGTWQRCIGVATWVNTGLSSHLTPVKQCDAMGPAQSRWDFAFADPPLHIDG